MENSRFWLRPPEYVYLSQAWIFSLLLIDYLPIYANPKKTLRNTLGIIMCGEADERFEPTYAFFAQGRKLGLPLVWRGDTSVGHELTPQVVKMAQAFLKFYANGEKPQNLVGDIQYYRFYEPGSVDEERVPPESRVILPSRKVAEAFNASLSGARSARRLSRKRSTGKRSLGASASMSAQ